MQTAFTALHPGVTVISNFGASSALVQQIQNGAPADVVATADVKSVGTLVDAKLVDAPTTFVKNKLEIIVPTGNPAKIAGLADLAKPSVKVALCAEQVPCGKFAKQILTAAGLAVTPVTLEENVKGVVTKVTTGEVDAGIVYVTDAKAAAGKADGIEIPDAQNATAEYPISTVTATKNNAAAKAFVAFVTSKAGQAILTKFGFAAP